MKTIYLITILVLSYICVSATTSPTAAIVVVPAKPKSVIVKDFRVMYGLEGDMKEYITQKIKEGYIVKSVAMMDGKNSSKGVVIMEKY